MSNKRDEIKMLIRKGEIKKTVLGIFSVFIFILLSEFISSQNFISLNNVEYESEILDAFNNQTLAQEMLNESGIEILKIENTQTWIRVMVRLKDDSGTMPTEISEREEWFKPRVEEVLNSLSEEEIKTYANLSDGFSAFITKQGFEKIINNDAIRRVHWLREEVKLFLDDSAPLINATYAWDTLGYTGDGIKVCVIDTGVDTNHPDLSGKVVAEKCYCYDNCCPNGTSEDNNATDDNGHGTHVVGIIASQDSTYKGISYDANIYVVKVTNYRGGSDDIVTSVAQAIDWCRNQGVDVISMSLGWEGPYNETNSCPPDLDIEINNTYNSNIPLIAASGNEYWTNGIAFPACQENLISVGATDKQDNFARGENNEIYSNRYSTLDLLAPGGEYDQTPQYSEIISTFSQRVRNDDNLCFYYWQWFWFWPWWPFAGCKDDDFEVNTYFIRAGGTSMAAPHVAGAVALMLEKNSSLTPSEIRQILIDTGKPIWDPGTERTYPRIDVAAAIDQVPFCNCTSWTAGSCGQPPDYDPCLASERQYTRTCNPSGCDIESKCEYDTSCGGGGKDITVCYS